MRKNLEPTQNEIYIFETVDGHLLQFQKRYNKDPDLIELNREFAEGLKSYLNKTQTSEINGDILSFRNIKIQINDGKETHQVRITSIAGNN